MRIPSLKTLSLAVNTLLMAKSPISGRKKSQRLVGDSELGVVHTSQAEWSDFLEQVRNGLFVDYSDSCITVEFLNKGGELCHGHPSPFTLEKVTEWQDKQEWEFMKCAGELLNGKGTLDYFLALYDKNKEQHSVERDEG